MRWPCSRLCSLPGAFPITSAAGPSLIVATAIQAATMLLFAHADGLTSLLIARVIQGLSVGAAVAAVGAGLLDIDKSRGTTANAVTAPLGTATGGLLAGLIIHYLPAPTHLVYYVLAVVFVLQGVGVLFMKRRSRRVPARSASLKPQIGVPANVRGPLLAGTTGSHLCVGRGWFLWRPRPVDRPQRLWIRFIAPCQGSRYSCSPAARVSR